MLRFKSFDRSIPVARIGLLGLLLAISLSAQASADGGATVVSAASASESSSGDFLLSHASTGPLLPQDGLSGPENLIDFIIETEQAKLLASDGAANDWFGWSVAISGDTALVGALSDVYNCCVSGSPYVCLGRARAA